MTPERFRELYLLAKAHNDSVVLELLTAFIHAEAMREKAERLGHMENTCRPSRFRNGKKEPNPYYGWQDADWIKNKWKEFLGVEKTDI